MSDEQYRKYYWKHLQQIILAIIASGKVPYIYTEGKYNSRLDCLTEVPPGKVFYHFEDVDMAVAKKKLAGIACISGGFPASWLDWAKPEEIRDEVKRLLDDCAPGGGFIFETSCGLGKCKRENVEAMFETVKEYGKYR
jgi:uroporphyrinogen-III decarboxylase